MAVSCAVVTRLVAGAVTAFVAVVALDGPLGAEEEGVPEEVDAALWTWLLGETGVATGAPRSVFAGACRAILRAVRPTSRPYGRRGCTARSKPPGQAGAASIPACGCGAALG